VDVAVVIYTLEAEVVFGFRFQAGEKRVVVGMGAAGHVLIQGERAEVRRFAVDDGAGHRHAGLNGQGGAAVIGEVGHFQFLVYDGFYGQEVDVFYAGRQLSRIFSTRLVVRRAGWRR